MTHTVGKDGQVVVPKAELDRLGIVPGDEIELESVEDGVLIKRRNSVLEMRGMFEGETNMADQLLEDRAHERK